MQPTYPQAWNRSPNLGVRSRCCCGRTWNIPSRRCGTSGGTARRVEAAFRTGLERYELSNGNTGQATTSAVSVQRSIASSVTAVLADYESSERRWTS
jgi:hypothetical protein